MTAGLSRKLPDIALTSAEAALELFFETWRLSAGEGDSPRARRLRLGALRLLQRVTAVGLEESRVVARVRVREARVEHRRLEQAVRTVRTVRTARSVRSDTSRGWDELSVALGEALSRLNQALCSPEPWIPTHPAPPSTFDARPQAHDSRLTTHDTRLYD